MNRTTLAFVVFVVGGVLKNHRLSELEVQGFIIQLFVKVVEGKTSSLIRLETKNAFPRQFIRKNRFR